MAPATTAVVLVGFQNEFFTEGGAFFSDIVGVHGPGRVLQATVDFLECVKATETLMVATPMVLTPDEIAAVDSVGMLTEIKARDAFQEGTTGVRLVEALARFGQRIRELSGRRGFSAFSHTGLDEWLSERQIRDVVIAGALTCVCIDATARAAYERGYRVTILSDCTLGRTSSEQLLFCERIFPLYAQVMSSEDVARRLSEPIPSAW